MPRPAQSEDQREDVRQRILVAAQALFDEAGIEAVSMRAIGARVGLTASALYAYFPTKLDLLRGLWWGVRNDMYFRMQVLSRDEPDPLAALRAIAKTYVEFALENPSRFRVLFMVDQGELAAELKNAGIYHDSFSLLRQRVAQAIEQGKIQPLDPDFAAQMLWAGVHGTLTLTSSAGSFPFVAPEVLAASIVDTLLAGLQPAPAKRRPK